MTDKNFDIGMVGLGVMGRNLALNLAERGFAVAGYDLDEKKRNALRQESGDRNVCAADSLSELTSSLKTPRATIMLVPAGAPVDLVINDLLPHLFPGDLLIDGGNSHFVDTNRRIKQVEEQGLGFIGMGISGGAAGARHGPSMMPGGSEAMYQRVRPMLEAAAAKVNGDPCVRFLGSGSAGHYVKMVHNGIEYGIMQLIAESYDLMAHVLEMNEDQIADTFSRWNDSDVGGFLVEITAAIFRQPDDLTDGRLVNSILDVAEQKGTGLWTSQEAMALQVPAPTIDVAVSMRDLSTMKVPREAAAKALALSHYKYDGNLESLLLQLREALFIGMAMTYAQGMSVLQAASNRYDYGLKLEDVVSVWRGGCIIRSKMLEIICSAYERNPKLPHLLSDQHLAERIRAEHQGLRSTVHAAAAMGVPVPGMMVSLGYLDAICSPRLPANLIQAQRDYFGAHTYERIDRSGKFHTDWES